MTASTGLIYAESVPNPWWLQATIWLGPPAVLFGLASVWREEAGVARALGVAVLLAVAAGFVAVGVWFRALRIEVSREALRYGWGPVGAVRRWPDVLDAEVEPYRWLTYGGWGLRFSTDKRRAYSVPGVRFGVAVRTRDGKRTHLASRQPEALCAAIRSMVAAAPGDARGGDE